MPLMVGVTDIDEVGGKGFLSLVAASAGDETAIDIIETAVRILIILIKIHPRIRANFVRSYTN